MLYKKPRKSDPLVIKDALRQREEWASETLARMNHSEPLDASKVDGKDVAKMVKDVADRDYKNTMRGPMLVAYLHPKEDGTHKLTCNLPIKKKRLPKE